MCSKNSSVKLQYFRWNVYGTNHVTTGTCISEIFAHANVGSRGVGFSLAFVCLSARYINKLCTEMFHHESWKSIYFGVKKSKIKVTRYKNSAGEGFCTLVSAGVFYFS